MAYLVGHDLTEDMNHLFTASVPVSRSDLNFSQYRTGEVTEVEADRASGTVAKALTLIFIALHITNTLICKSLNIKVPQHYSYHKMRSQHTSKEHRKIILY